MGIAASLIAATSVFIGTLYLSQWLFTKTILPLSLMAFCPPLVAILTLFLVRYGVYIYHNKTHLPSCSIKDVLKNCILFYYYQLGPHGAI